MAGAQAFSAGCRGFDSCRLCRRSRLQVFGVGLGRRGGPGVVAQTF